MSVLLRHAVAAVALAALGAAAAAGLAPFVLDERPAGGSAVGATPTLTGPAQAAAEGLRGLGYTCADSEVFALTVTRVCTRVRNVESARVRMLVTTETGAVRQVSTTIDEARSARASHADVLKVLTGALGLDAGDRDRILSAVATDADGLLTLGWGSFFLRAGVAPESQLRVAPSNTPPLDRAVPMLAGSVDALAEAARSRGYRCTIPQVETIRSCERDEGGYTYRLWMDGTDTAVAELDLEVLATYRTETHRRWHDEMSVVLSWVDTDQGRSVASWLAQNAEAPGADSYVDGLSVSFFVRTDEYVKETFGGIHR